ncbi:Uncharacterised protein [Vibrio cholerae]|nr:Uncharacterised protein [Vibrio cholerae]
MPTHNPTISASSRACSYMDFSTCTSAYVLV